MPPPSSIYKGSVVAILYERCERCGERRKQSVFASDAERRAEAQQRLYDELRLLENHILAGGTDDAL